MISVNRSAVSKPVCLTDEKGLGAKELVRARNYINGPKVKKAFPFSAYKDGEVKTRLEALFHGKCAYCESFYSQTQPVDVEHYRPKGRVAEAGADHPGYWWLAMEWENLLPSCIDCNRKRGQTLPVMRQGTLLELHDGARFSSSVQFKSGKQDSFPLANGSPYAVTEKDDLALEIRLLLDPTRDNPESHLAFHIDRQNLIGLVYPKPLVATQPPQLPMVHNDPSRISDHANSIGASPAGAVSIQVYGLNRLALVQARTQILRELEFLLTRTEDIEEILVEVSNRRTECENKKARARGRPRSELIEELSFLSRIESRLKQFRDALQNKMRERLDEKAPYAAQARAWVRKYLSER